MQTSKMESFTTIVNSFNYCCKTLSLNSQLSTEVQASAILCKNAELKYLVDRWLWLIYRYRTKRSIWHFWNDLTGRFIEKSFTEILHLPANCENKVLYHEQCYMQLSFVGHFLHFHHRRTLLERGKKYWVSKWKWCCLVQL